MLKAIIEQLENRESLPVEIEEIANLIVASGAQDEIFIFPANVSGSRARGAVRQFRQTSFVPYADSEWVTHIGYSSEESAEWQRVICAKELVHIFDTDLAKTDKAEEVVALIDKLIGPMGGDAGLADLQALKDKFALYQCLPLLFPKAALERARIAIAEGRQTVASVAQIASMPVALVSFMLNSSFPDLQRACAELDAIGAAPLAAAAE